MKLVFILGDKDKIASDFYISQYPVTEKEFQEVVGGRLGHLDLESEKQIKKATWMEAVKYCNLLNTKNMLPKAYDENTGLLVDENGNPITREPLLVNGIVSHEIAYVKVKGFRLPTSPEWEYAAKGCNQGKKCGDYHKILEKTFKNHYDPNREVFLNGPSNTDDLEANTLGLFGMLGNAREWYGENETYYAGKNTQCFWEEYYYTYDDLALQVARKKCGDSNRCAFRVVINDGAFVAGRWK
jgi:formylglycine-generating enzyme required for sulfatase activity